MNDSKTYTQQGYRLAENAIALFNMRHPEAKPADYRVVLHVLSDKFIFVEIVPTERYERESLN